jgi:sugar/nucleoside kinase (ribokinase family)
MHKFAVTGIGNAIVDVLAHVDEALLEREQLDKGAMILIDAARARELLRALPDQRKQSSGGSAANTVAGVASLGSRAAYIGKVGQDRLGEAFSNAMLELEVTFRTPPSQSQTPTAVCAVLVTPDAQRTMCTYLGACVELGPDDVDAELIAQSQITYLEGYLWDPPAAKQAFLRAAEIAHAEHGQVALSLSDSFCVERHRESFLELLLQVDILFANEGELCALYGVPDVRSALTRSRDACRITAVTLGARGCALCWDGSLVEFPAEPVHKVVDTTGAGDLFAAGFLHGLALGRSPSECAKLGGVAAAEVISHVGARPEVSLAALTRTQS